MVLILTLSSSNYSMEQVDFFHNQLIRKLDIFLSNLRWCTEFEDNSFVVTFDYAAYKDLGIFRLPSVTEHAMSSLPNTYPVD